jgi:hypothetical protein
MAGVARIDTAPCRAVALGWAAAAGWAAPETAVEALRSKLPNCAVWHALVPSPCVMLSKPKCLVSELAVAGDYKPYACCSLPNYLACVYQYSTSFKRPVRGEPTGAGRGCSAWCEQQLPRA